MRFYLSGVGVERQSQSLFDKRTRYFRPVQMRIGEVVRIVVPHSSVEFTIYFNFLQVRQLFCQSIAEVSVLFAKSSGGCGLSVRVGQHRMFGPFNSFRHQSLQDIFGTGQVDLSNGLFQHEGICQIIDIFTCTTEMDVFFVVVKVLLDKIFNRFQVVVRSPLNLFHLLGGGHIEGRRHRVQFHLEIGS
jgi:hypothetical protein